MPFAKNPIIYLAKKEWHYSKGNRRNVVLYVALFVLSNAVALTEPLIVASIFNAIQVTGLNADSLPHILQLLSLFIATAIGFWLFHGPARVIELQNAFFAGVNYKQFLLDGVMDLPASWHTDHHSGDTIDKVEKGSKALYLFSSETFEIMEMIIRFVGSYIALMYFHLASGYIVAILVFVTLLIILLFDRVLSRQYIAINRMENAVSAKVYDTISNITTVIILRVEKLVSAAIRKTMLRPYTLFHRNIRVNEVKWFFVTLCGAIMIVLILASYVMTSLQAGEVVLIGTLFALYGYVSNIQNLFFRFAYKYGEIVRMKAAVLNSEELAQQFQETRSVPEVPLAPGWKQVTVRNLEFSYPTEDGDEIHLDDISFSFRHGEKIAFVGESGSGKTTTLKIIRGLYEPQSVEVRVDGELLPHHFQSIREQIALIPQDPEVFNSTIEENITMGVPYPQQLMEKFTRLARFDQVVQQLPKKYASSIVEKGVNLSGGEKQRLALTRGLIASMDKDIVLLDEPTSSVDPKNEMEIYEQVFEEFDSKTIISAIHRLHLLSLFDTVYIFSQGKIVTHGTFEELKRISPEFQVLWKRYQKEESRSEHTA